MATYVSNLTIAEKSMVKAINDQKAAVGAGANFHLDQCDPTGQGVKTTPISAANATDLATSLALCVQLTGALNFHCADHRATAPNTAGAHKVADTTLPAALSAISAIIDLASCITAANAMKAAYNTHRASTTYHDNADATNTITSADATDLASLQTLLNEMKTDIGAHMISAPANVSLKVV